MHEPSAPESTLPAWPSNASQTTGRRTRITFPDGSFKIIAVRVPDVMSQECRNFYLWDAPECAGCEFPKDIEYQKRMEQA